jgi:hypothetical protein
VRSTVKKSLLIFLFAGLNLVLIQNCGDSNTAGSQRQYLDNDVNDPDRSQDNDGDTFQDNDLNDRDGSLDNDAMGMFDNDVNDPDRSVDSDGDTVMEGNVRDNDPNDPDRSADNDGDMFDNDKTTDMD